MGMMGGKGGGKNALAAKPNLLSALRIQTSSYGQVIPILYGQNRIAARLIWAGDFAAIPHTSTTKVGGKGLGSGGGNAISNTTYTYQTAVAMALCMGPIVNIQNVWDTKGRLTLLTTSVPFTVPMGGGGITVSPPGSGVFHSQRGVSRADSFTLDTGPNGDFGSDGHFSQIVPQKTPMKLVTGSPGAGQYTQSGSVFTFSADPADVGKVMTITYVYSVPDSNSTGAPQQKLSLTLFTGVRPQTPWTYLTSAHPGQDLGYNGIAYVASSAMDLGESGTLPNLSFEVLGILPFGGDITDSEPSSVIADLLANPFYGLAGVVTPGDLTQYRTFCTANGLFLSPVLDAQKTAAAWIQEILDITNAAAVWSEGVLKIVPYGDTSVAANGAVFTPNTHPIYDLTTADLLSQVIIKRPSVAEVMNAVSVEWCNRANDYNVDVAEDKDDAMIALYGLRKAQPVQAHSITTTTVAKFAANLLRKRSVEVRATYTFNLGWQFNLLEPMDMLTLTVPELGYNRKPVRITAMREDENGTIQIDAEDFPWGTATPTLYPHQAGSGFVTQANADPGSVSPPIIFEANDRLSLTGNYEVWIGACGGHTNLLIKSEQFDDAIWRKHNASVSANSITDPLGGMTADAVTFSGGVPSDAYFYQQTTLPLAAGMPFTFSCWLKVASGSPSITLSIEDKFAVRIAGSKVCILNQTWQRFSVTMIAASDSTGITPFISTATDQANTYHLWGAQLEQASAMTGYIQTTTTPLTVATPDWGGCSVWLSPDNTNYAQIGKMYGPSRMGALTAQLVTSADPDITHTLAVDLTQSAGILNSGSQADCDNFRTISYVDGELISYEDATLTSSFHYDLGTHGSPLAITGASFTTPIQITATAHGFSSGETVVIAGVAGNTAANGTWVITIVDANTFKLNGSAGNALYTSGGTASILGRLRRGVFGSPIGTHNANSTFLRLDDGVFVWEADPTLVAFPNAITGATNASPISITDPAHGYSTGQTVQIAGVGGNTAANGTWVITVVDANTFTLNGSIGNGAYTSGGAASAVLFLKFTSFNRFGLMEQSLASATAYTFAFNGLFGNNNETPANNATIDSVFVSGTADNIRIYGPSGVGTPYTVWKMKDQGGTRTIPAQTITVVEETTPTPPQTNTAYWISYDFNSATHRAWRNYNNYVQAIYRGQLRVGMINPTVKADGTGGGTGGQGDSGDGGSGDPGRILPNI
jgi:hypothetical protein